MYEKTDEIREQLKAYTPGNMKERLPLLDTLMELHHGATAAVDIERARYMTAHFKETEDLNIPIP